MNPPAFTARRATVEDIIGLRALWRTEQLPELELERRVTDFQVAIDAEGRVAGAVGLRVEGTQGCLHSEVFLDFGQADTLRPLLWDRVQTVARNRGLSRLWTLEKTQFWRGMGFDPVSGDVKKKFPAAFGDGEADWLVLKLKDDFLENLTPEQEIVMFQSDAKESTEKMMRQAKVLKWVAAIVAVLFLAMTVVAAIYFVRIERANKKGLLPSTTPATRR